MLFGPNFVTARMQDVWAMTPFHASSKSEVAVSAAQIYEMVEESPSEETTVVSEKVSHVDSGVREGTGFVPVCI
jgi:hypothetical protein